MASPAGRCPAAAGCRTARNRQATPRSRPPLAVVTGAGAHVGRQEQEPDREAGALLRRAKRRRQRATIQARGRAGSAARRRCGLCGQWSPRRRPPNRTCDFHRIRLSMSTTSDRSPVRLALSVKYPLHSCSGAPMFIGDLLPSSRAACSLDAFALWAALPPSPVGRDCHDYYGSSAAPRRQRRTVRLPHTLAGSAGTAGALATFTHTPVGRIGAQLYPGGIAAPHRDAARGLAARDKASERDGPERVRGPSAPTAHSPSFGGR
jgi:hypothetical protein